MAATTTRGKQASSSNYMTTTRSTYHVFLSFRGADTRKTFADHLYTALTDTGFRTFRDDEEIERGEVIASELEKAIRQSRSSIIVFSEDYASSRWCLDELELILELKRNNSKYIVIPVFYHVDPSDVRFQKGIFREAFRKHEERFAEDGDKKKKKIESWRKALKEVADLSGNDLENQANGNEAKFIKLIVEDLAKKLDLPILNVDPYTVGIKSRVEDINWWLQEESDDVGIAAIYGMGGIGKTTIAKVVYNKNYGIFEASSFLANIREECEKHNGLIGLLKQLYSDILKGRELKTNNVDVGINQIRDALGCKRLLLVLDDVDRLDKLNSILGFGSLDWLCEGTKIIVTTRHERLLKAYGPCEMFEVSKLTDVESLLLFSRHAFKKDHPTECYMEHAKNIVQKCGGIPLAIQVLGKTIFELGDSLALWESVIEKMDNIVDSDILKVLRISYDSLKDDKRLFLDIACFFVGKDIKFAVQVLNDCDLFPTVGIQNLVNRCLITVSIDNKLMIHQLLQDMAREIVRQESPNDPGSRTRVLRDKDAFEILKEKSGTKRVTGLILNLQLLKEEDVDLETTAFSRMRNLQLLHLDYVRLSGGYGEMPKKLRWLSWHGFHLKCIPSDFDMENMVALDMRNSYLVNVWNGGKSIKRLKILNLCHSHCLVNTPNFSGVPNLEELILKDCIKLEEIDSVGDLRKLVLLDLEGCKSLRNLPGKVGLLKSLEKLIFSSCSNLKDLPVELCEMESLTHLSADGTAINQLPSTSGHLINACNFRAKVSQSLLPQTSLTMIPKPIQFSLASLPISLKHLNLANNRLTDDVMPVDMSCLSSLEYLNLGGNLLTRLPESIKGLTMLEKLMLDSCTRLESLPELPLCLRSLSAYNCVSLEWIKYQPNRSRSFLHLFLCDCEKLVEFENMFMVAPLVNFDMKMVCDLGLVGFESIEEGIQVETYSWLTRTRKKGPVQGLYEFGILSTFYPCSKVPDWFSIKALVDGWYTDIRFTIPSLVNIKIRCLSFCKVYSDRNDFDWVIYNRIRVSVCNISKCLQWTYSPTIYGVGRGNEDMIWFGQSSFGNKFEGGDQVAVEFNCESGWTDMKEVGVHVYYEKLHEKEIVQQTTNQSVMEGGLQSYDDMLRAHSLGSSGESLIYPFHRGMSILKTDERWEPTNPLFGITRNELRDNL